MADEVQKWLLSWWSIPGGALMAGAGWLVRRRSFGPWIAIRWVARVTTANVRLAYREEGDSALEQEMQGLREDLSRALLDNERLRSELSRLAASGAGSTGSGGARSRSRSSTRRSRK